MSLAETQEIMQVLQEIIRLLDGVEVKTTKLTDDLPKTKEAIGTFREAERLALRYLVIARRLGLPDDITKATQMVAQLIVMVKMLQIALGAMSKGVMGGLLGFGSMLVVGLSINDMMQMG